LFVEHIQVFLAANDHPAAPPEFSPNGLVELLQHPEPGKREEWTTLRLISLARLDQSFVGRAPRLIPPYEISVLADLRNGIFVE
jgi:hypothetical protein